MNRQTVSPILLVALAGVVMAAGIIIAMQAGSVPSAQTAAPQSAESQGD